MNEIIIKQSKVKSIGMVILGIVMLLASVFVLAFGTIHKNIVYIIIGIIGMGFFVPCEIYSVKRALNPKPLLVITEDGITDMSSACSVGFIAWNEIESVSVIRVFSQRLIAITVYDIDKVLNRISSAKQKVIKANLKLNYPPIAIPINTADVNFNEVLSIIQSKLNEHNLRVNN